MRRFSLRLAAVLTLSFLSVFAADAVWAEVHGSCHHCGRLVVIQEWGAGLNRDWQGHCGRCALLETIDAWAEEGDTPRDTIGRIRGKHDAYGSSRYVLLEDGTAIDMRHFMTAANLESKVVAVVGGHLAELQQYYKGQHSGRPFTVNDDTVSNKEGGIFGTDGVDNDSDLSLGTQIVDFLESRHGPILGVTDVDAMHFDNLSEPIPPKGK